MKFTDNPEITAANMDASDILAGTEVSAGADRKFTLSGLATWMLTTFTASFGGVTRSVKSALDNVASRLGVVENGTNAISKHAVETYTGAQLAGSYQTVKDAINGIVATSSASFSLSMGGYSATAYAFKRGGNVEITFPDGGGTTFASFTNGGQVGTLPTGYRPSHAINVAGVARKNWDVLYPIVVRIASTGEIYVNGKQADIRTCNYIMVTAEFHV